jgi:hypothetical protein
MREEKKKEKTKQTGVGGVVRTQWNENRKNYTTTHHQKNTLINLPLSTS